MAREDIRSNGKNIPLTHHSARGRVQRNSGNFTRGSQLLTHEMLMWFSGAKLPILAWFFAFLLAWFIILSIRLDEHGFQLVCMKVYAGLWNWVDLNPNKRVNVTLPSGEIYKTIMPAVPYIPAVQKAWATTVHALIGSLLVSIFVVTPLAIWFVDISRRRGKTILQERHERGAMLVDYAVLVSEIAQHNAAKFAEDARQFFPRLSQAAVLRLPFSERKAGGIHHPYSLAGVPYPHRLEQSHTMLIGTTGAGKTTELRSLVTQMRQRQDNAVIFDLTGAYVEAFYDPARDTILNPMDQRCPAWSIFNDCSTYSHFTSAAAALIPSDGGSSEPFWALAARTLFIEMCVRLAERGQTSNLALSENLMTADLKRVHRFLANTIADPLTAPEAARMAESIRAVFNTNAQVLRFLPDEGEQFSIRQWMTVDRAPGSILFVTSDYDDLEMNKPLLTLWMNLAITSLMTLPRTRSLRTWFMFDEVGALHRLPAIEKGLQTARNFGGAMILGLHSFQKLVEVYGEEGARNLASLARTKLILATSELKTAEECSQYIGNREVRQMDEAYSYGYNNNRDASTLTPRKQVEPLVIADDITNLPSMHGFVKFPDGFPAARILLEWKDYPEVARGFMPRPSMQPVRSRRGEEAFSEEGDEAGGRDGAAQIIDEVAEASNVAKEMAARILQTPSEEESADPARATQRNDDKNEQSTPATRAGDKALGKDGEQAATTRGEGDRRDARGAVSPAPQVEDQTLIELRQGFAAGRDGDDLDMGI
ncbi:type IV secretion system DNA-binding domain-containing protein [Sphingomonadaceae bacterium G21617-S1]|uniref:type IV secretion system DNA-binding domain-containing protein n=1 Tax=Sphingomonadales TaxID=204457 RepID=UPI000C20A229|nr:MULTISPECIES: type IV secretion system DNA-binding domain-containing protein [Sphingomonadaceae]MCF8707130.1 type IV secretion system DNA-binding domain-containing protein [Rhizorhapis sp. SPR117]MCZ4343467.1 type IV secretion system DNA-binding domain-containing protein [Sphingomonadaceae bacterium G21617-S1]PJG45226.1 conjugal transfer protein TraD [Sphingobium sp. LB126]